MIEAHKKLLELVQAAEVQARAVMERGASGLETQVRNLRQTANEIKDRIRQYKDQARRDAKAAAPTATAPDDGAKAQAPPK